MMNIIQKQLSFRCLRILSQLFSSFIAIFAFGSVIMAQINDEANTLPSQSLVLLYADLENSLGLNFQDFQESQNGVEDDELTILRTELKSYVESNPDVSIHLAVDSGDNNQIYKIQFDTDEQTVSWTEDNRPFRNFTNFLTESINKAEYVKSVFFAMVSYDNEWIQNIRPVIDPIGNPCIANPAYWRDDGRPDKLDDGGRPIPGGDDQGRGHTDLERALCDVPEETDQVLGVLPFGSVLDFLSNRSDVGECSSLDSLMPHVTIKSQFINVSSTSSGTVAGISFQNRDILRYDMTNNQWSMLFDASDVGINKGNLDAFHVMGDDNILFSLSRPLSIPGLGRVDDSDIVRFVPTHLGSNTAGHFEIYFDGSDVQLARGSEDIDAISMLSDGSLLISTVGNVSVNGVRKGRDEDVLLFEPTSLGKVTKGKWSLYLDGSKVGLRTKNENIVGIDFDPSLPAREALHLATRGNFVVPLVRGTNPDILSYAPDEASQCTFEMSQRWNDFKEFFAGEKLDGISYQIGHSEGLRAASSSGEMVLGYTEQPIDDARSYSLYLPIVSRE